MRKLTLSLLMVVIIAMLGIGWALDGLFESYFESEDSLHSRSYLDIGKILATIIDHQDDSVVPLHTTQVTALNLTIIQLDEFPLPEELEASFISGKPLALESDGESTLSFYLPKRQQVLTLVTPRSTTENGITYFRIFFTALFYGGIIFLLLLWLYPLIGRLVKLKNTSLAFGKGDLSQRVETHSMSYITEIETTFNQMAQRIQTLVNDNKLLGNAVSHDLRTPLARLRFGIDALAETTDAKTQIKYQKRISKDIDAMESLVETLLNYAQLDQSMIELNKTDINLVVVALSCIKQYSTQGPVIDTSINDKVINVAADKQYLAMVLNNVLSNALQYANKKVKLSIQRSSECVTLTVEDDGCGIDESQVDEVVKPFVRGKKSTTNNGYGMGLAIAKRIAQWHGGELSISRSPQLGGACIKITLPAL